jgi:tRNA dimethylallyltransferase
MNNSTPSSQNPILVIVCGPTGVGKTAVSLQLASRWNTEIVSTDSRQFYREMNAATGKPTVEELDSIKHHFINNLSIHDHYSAGQYELEASKLLESLFTIYPIVFAVGGSGLYFKALAEGLDHCPYIPSSLKSKLEQELIVNGLNTLLEELQNADPVYYEKVDKNNSRRIIRALSVIRISGKPFSSFLTNQVKQKSYRTIYLRLGLERPILYERINKRVESFLNNGLFKEAKQLYSYRHLTALQTPGYKEVFDFMDDKISKQEAIDKIKQHNRNYAKRQETWLNQYVGDTTFHPDDMEGIVAYISLNFASLTGR